MSDEWHTVLTELGSLRTEVGHLNALLQEVRQDRQILTSLVGVVDGVQKEMSRQHDALDAVHRRLDPITHLEPPIQQQVSHHGRELHRLDAHEHPVLEQAVETVTLAVRDQATKRRVWLLVGGSIWVVVQGVVIALLITAASTPQGAVP